MPKYIICRISETESDLDDIKCALKVIPNPKLRSGCSISKNMVVDFVKEFQVSTIGDKTTMVRAILVNGFEIIKTSSCVDVANYDENMGAEICMSKIYDDIWYLLGFLLQTAVGGMK